MNSKDQFRLLYENYSVYREDSVRKRDVKYQDVLKYLNSIKENDSVKITTIGKSLENRSINYLTIGTGKTNVLMWSQMHGDESTATMALFDLLNFLLKDTKFEELRKPVLENLTLHIIPMLNPDGAERVSRRNAAGIDINRDAVTLQTPEAQLLMNLRETIKPEFGFNLHDQDSGYSAGYSYKSAAISLLAPPFDLVESLNPARQNAVSVCADIFEEISEFIPGHIAKYDEEFEPRAFGDNFVKKGTSTVLIEAGGWANDIHKQFIRKIYFLSLLKGLHSAASVSYKNKSLSDYGNIPLNKERLFDLILRNVLIPTGNQPVKVDIGIKRELKYDQADSAFYYIGTIADIGDLSVFNGYDEIDLSGYTVTESKIEETEELLNNEEIIKNLKNGTALYVLKNINIEKNYLTVPVNYFCRKKNTNKSVTVDNYANFFLTKDNNIIYAVVNGFLINPAKDKDFNGNGLIVA